MHWQNIVNNVNHKSIVFDQQHQSYVGFFKHSNNHCNIAYEFFTNDGPLLFYQHQLIIIKVNIYLFIKKENK